jgi:hypothetical protein
VRLHDIDGPTAGAEKCGALLLCTQVSTPPPRLLLRFNGNTITLGARGDSYYEYLLKQWVQTQQSEDKYKVCITIVLLAACV